MYEIFEKLVESNGISTYKVSKETGIATATFSDWKSGKSIPKRDKLQKIADYFGVTLEYLTSGKEEIEFDYLNEESRQIAKDAYNNPELRILFNASKEVSPEDLRFVIEMVKKLKK